MRTELRKYFCNKARLQAFLWLIGVAVMSGCSGQAADQARSSNEGRVVNDQSTTPDRATTAALHAPAAMEAEHKELHEQLENSIKSGGKTGEAAKVVEEHLSKHFKNEEEYALPQLGLLPALADGNVSPEMRPAIALSDRLKADMPKMLAEHKDIVKALEALAEAGKAENKLDAVRFAENLSAHAQTEEQVSYPTAILIGEYLKLKLKP